VGWAHGLPCPELLQALESRRTSANEAGFNPVQGSVKLRKVDTQNTNPNISEVSPVEGAAPETLESQLTAVTAERDKLAAEAADLQSRLRYARAEFDNARRRAERERSEYLQFAAVDLVKDILPILDDFERALQVETADRNYAKGVELIYQRMSETLKKLGLEPIETANQKFDPNLHQAVERVETENAEDQSILAEFQRGYNFKGKLLRPAMVKVAVKP
jgi:molecular chaperone GrpE